jgi:hypothetical protein
MNNEGDAMKCTEVQGLMLDYLEGQLGAEKAIPIEAHLALCESCRREKSAYEQSWALAEEWPDIEPDPLYRAKFWEKASRQERTGIWSALQDIFRAKRTALTALVSMILLLGAFALWHWSPAQPWEGQAYQPWNGNMMEHVIASVEGIEDSPLTAGAFFRDSGIIRLPDYVEENEEDLYPELDIGRSSFALMDGAWEMMGTMAGE